MNNQPKEEKMFTYTIQTDIKTVETAISCPFLMERDMIEISNPGSSGLSPLYKGETRSGRVITVDHSGEVVMTSPDKSTIFLAALVKGLYTHLRDEDVTTSSPEEGEEVIWAERLLREEEERWAEVIALREEDILRMIALQEAKPKDALPPKRRPKRDVVVKCAIK